jgi:sulfur carrier protein
MTIIINGQRQELGAAMSLLELLESRGLQPATVVVELNRGIVDRDAYARTALNDGDVLEVLRFVGGG